LWGLEIGPAEDLVPGGERWSVHLDGDSQTSAAHGSLGPQPLDRFEEAPRRNDAELDITLSGRSGRRFEHGFGRGGKRAARSADYHPAIVEGLHHGEALTEASEKELVGKDGVEKLADFARRSGSGGGINGG